MSEEILYYYDIIGNTLIKESVSPSDSEYAGHTKDTVTIHYGHHFRTYFRDKNVTIKNEID